jgi:hypothetical protein
MDDPLKSGEFPRAEAARARREAQGGADVTEEVRLFREELGEQHGRSSHREPTRAEQIGALSYDELLADRTLLDRVARAVCLNRDCGYMEAFEYLEEWCGYASTSRQTARSEVTIADMLGDSGPASFAAVCCDVVLMEREDASAKADVAALDVVLLDSTDAKIDQLEVSLDEINEAGQVQLSDRSDRAFLLTDAYTIERAWLRAKELTNAYDDPETGRADFEQHYRLNIEAGLDFVAGLEWSNGAARRQEAVKQRDRQVHQADRELAERKRRADERLLDAEIEERRRRL